MQPARHRAWTTCHNNVSNSLALRRSKLECACERKSGEAWVAACESLPLWCCCKCFGTRRIVAGVRTTLRWCERAKATSASCTPTARPCGVRFQTGVSRITRSRSVKHQPKVDTGAKSPFCLAEGQGRPLPNWKSVAWVSSNWFDSCLPSTDTSVS